MSHHTARPRSAAKPARRRRRRPLTHRDSLIALRDGLLPDDGIFAKRTVRGNTKWAPAGLVWRVQDSVCGNVEWLV